MEALGWRCAWAVDVALGRKAPLGVNWRISFGSKKVIAHVAVSSRESARFGEPLECAGAERRFEA